MVVWALTAHEVKKGLFFPACDFATNDADINNHAQTETQFPYRLQMEGKIATGDRVAGDAARLSEDA